MGDIREDLKSSKGDYALTFGKAIAGSIPVVGSAISETLGLLITEPISKRRDAWIISLYDELKALECKVDGFKIESLIEDEQFVTVLINSIQLAIKNNNEIKLRALRNACINTAFKVNTDEDKQLIFLKYVDELIPLDIKLLYHFMDPRKRCEESGVNINKYYSGSPMSTFWDCNNEDNIDRSIVKMRMEDLISKNLMSNFGYNATCTSQGMLSSRLSEIGNEFMKFITRDEI